MQDFKSLKIWKESHALAIEVYKLTKQFPYSERFGVSSQMRRAVASIPANIAEGSGRRTRTDFQRFLFNSQGSLKELEYFIILSNDLRYLSDEESDKILRKISQIARMVTGFIRSLHNQA